MTADDLADYFPTVEPRPALAQPRRCLHPRDRRRHLEGGDSACLRCGATIAADSARRSRNNRKRGNAAELVVAKGVGGRKVGPLGHPWDVEMPGYARLQVRKYVTPQGLRKIAAALDAIGSGAEMPGYVWVEPGRGGEQLIVFRLKDFAERHGIPDVDA